MAFGLSWFIQTYSPKQNWFTRNATLIVSVLAVTWLLAKYWLPLGAQQSLIVNFIFVGLIVGIILGGFSMLEKYYRPILGWCLNNKKTFLTIPVLLILLGGNVWFGFNSIFGFIRSKLLLSHKTN